MRAIGLLVSLLAIGSVPAFAAAGDDIEFASALAVSGKTTLQLKDKVTGTAHWFSVGDTFLGYKIESYDLATDTIVFSKNGVTSSVKLKLAKIGQATIAAAPSVVTPASPAAPTAGLPPTAPEVQRAVLNNMRQLGAAADQYFLENGTNHATLADLVGPKTYIKALNQVAGEEYPKEFGQGKDIVVSIPGGPQVTYKQ